MGIKMCTPKRGKSNSDNKKHRLKYLLIEGVARMLVEIIFTTVP